MISYALEKKLSEEEILVVKIADDKTVHFDLKHNWRESENFWLAGQSREELVSKLNKLKEAIDNAVEKLKEDDINLL